MPSECFAGFFLTQIFVLLCCIELIKAKLFKTKDIKQIRWGGVGGCWH